MVSDVWNFCTRLSDTQVKCNQCNRIMSYHGTTNLRVHVGRHFGIRPQRIGFSGVSKGCIKLPQQVAAVGQGSQNFSMPVAAPKKSSTQSYPQIIHQSRPPTPPQPPPEVCLRWNSYHSNMQATFPSLLNNEQFVDVTLACEGQSIKCHKMILSACSSYFEQLLSQNPCQHPIVLMKDLKFWEVRALVDFMYRGEVNVGQDKLPSLLSAAEALQIKGLASPTTSSSSSSTHDSDTNFYPMTEEVHEEAIPSPGSRKKRKVASSTVTSQTQNSDNWMNKSPAPSTSSYQAGNKRSESPPRQIRRTENIAEVKIEPSEISPDSILDDDYDTSNFMSETEEISSDRNVRGGGSTNTSLRNSNSTVRKTELALDVPDEEESTDENLQDSENSEVTEINRNT